MPPLDSASAHLAKLTAAGLGQAEAKGWSAALAGWTFSAPRQPAQLDADAAAAGEIRRQGWSLLERLPARSARSEAEKAAGEAITMGLADLWWRFSRVHRAALYAALTNGGSEQVRVDELAWRAGERWPTLFPTRAEVAREAARMQKDKDGLEIAQGCLLGQLLSDREAGTHLIHSMLRPRPESEARLAEFMAKGFLDLGGARVEARGEAGYVFFHNPRSLNAEDADTLGPQEMAIDLVLLHPGLRMGVLRGDPVDHAKYAGRRVFTSGINLTRLYHGKIPYLFYIVRDLGLVNKLYRGLAGEEFFPHEPEDTLEKPWMAVVDGFAIGGGCQLLLVMDYVLAEAGAYFNLPARKEGIIPGAANLRLPRFMGEGRARRGIMFDATFPVDAPEAAALISEVHPAQDLDAAVEAAVANAVGSGMVSAAGNRKALRVQTEPLESFRRYMATYCREQAFCHLAEQLTHNLEKHWQAKERRL